MEDSDEDDDDNEMVPKMEDVDDKDVKTQLSPEDVKFQGELADGVRQIKASLITPLSRVIGLTQYNSSSANIPKSH